MADQKLERKLIIKPYDRMVKDLVNEIEEKRIILDPEYQRNYVWKNDKASLLVESILLNIPIPVLYASENDNGDWVIVDGLQRLYSLKRYFSDEFKLKGLETLSNLNGLKYSDLEPTIQNKLSRGELRIIVLQNESDPEIQFDIFQRLNTGSVSLNEQELRNCMYRGKYNDMIKNIVKTSDETKEIFPQGKTDRMLTNELILRYLAFSENFNKINNSMENYDGRIKNLLNKHMKKYQNADEELLTNHKDKYINQIKKSYMIFGKDAFKITKNTKINACLYECIMIGFENYSNEQLLSKKNEILTTTTELLKEPNFFLSITKATGNTETTNYRLSTYSNKLKEIFEC